MTDRRRVRCHRSLLAPQLRAAHCMSFGTNVPSGSVMSSTGCRPIRFRAPARRRRSAGRSCASGPARRARPAHRLRPAPAAVACSRGAAAATISRSSTKRSSSSCFQLVLGGENLLFVLFELRRDVPLGVFERLLADVVRRDFLAMGVRDFEVVAEHRIEADLHARDAGPLAFGGLILGHPLLAAGSSTRGTRRPRRGSRRG